MNPGPMVVTEDLLVGDDIGDMYYYVVEWPLSWEVARDNWPGSVRLMAKISIHSQQICGLAWSPRGDLFASGGNDNLCCLFEVDKIISNQRRADISSENQRPGLNYSAPWLPVRRQSRGHCVDVDLGKICEPTSRHSQNCSSSMLGLSLRNPKVFAAGCERQHWIHRSAVKAISFCPWLNGLVATGGGSNDQAIHFFHAGSGSALAAIAVSAQVTSLIWSTTKREIVATFGYAHPEHPYRIAVFNWPECTQVAAIP